MSETKRRVQLLLSIVERGQGKLLAALYEKHQVSWHYQCVGCGTASSDLLDILGMGGTERDILISMAAGSHVRRLIRWLDEEEGLPAKGIAFSANLTGLNSRMAAALLQGTGDEEREETGMEQKEKGSLILVAVNQGHTEEVMNTARAAGARGGTILRSRYAGPEEEAGLYGTALQEEKEIIAIAAQPGSRNVIMEAVNKKHGLSSEAGAVICSVALEEMVRLG